MYRIWPDAAPGPAPWRWSGLNSWSPQRAWGRPYRPQPNYHPDRGEESINVLRRVTRIPPYHYRNTHKGISPVNSIPAKPLFHLGKSSCLPGIYFPMDRPANVQRREKGTRRRSGSPLNISIVTKERWNDVAIHARAPIVLALGRAHAKEIFPPHAEIDPAGGRRETFRSPPAHQAIGIGPRFPDGFARRIQDAPDDECFTTRKFGGTALSCGHFSLLSLRERYSSGMPAWISRFSIGLRHSGARDGRRSAFLASSRFCGSK